jgi:hypothetical protein
MAARKKTQKQVEKIVGFDVKSFDVSSIDDVYRYDFVTTDDKHGHFYADADGDNDVTPDVHWA